MTVEATMDQGQSSAEKRAKPRVRIFKAADARDMAEELCSLENMQPADAVVAGAQADAADEARRILDVTDLILE